MKIAHVVCTFPPYKGGIGNSAFEFCRELVLCGHEVAVFTPNYRGDLESEMMAGIIVERLDAFLKFGNGAFVPQLVNRLKDFDIVHLHYPFFGGAEAVWFAKVVLRQRFKLVIHYHMDVNLNSGFLSILRLPDTLTKKSLFGAAEAVICSSLDLAQNSELRKVYPLEKVIGIPFGVDTDRFVPLADRKSGDVVNFLYVGSIDRAHYFKGVDVLLNALAKLAQKNWFFTAVANGDLKAQYERQAHDLNIASQVVFRDNVSYDALPEAVREADVLVLPAINSNEAFGIVLLEAMSSGLAVIASKLPGVRTVFEDGAQGFLAEPADVDDLKEKLERFIADKDLRRQMGGEGRKLAVEKYNWKVVVKRLEEVYNSIKH